MPVVERAVVNVRVFPWGGVWHWDQVPAVNGDGPVGSAICAGHKESTLAFPTYRYATVSIYTSAGLSVKNPLVRPGHAAILGGPRGILA